MADYNTHLFQAQHNEKVANKLIREPSYHDWGITAGFYAAIHYFESWLFNQEEKHTETSIPLTPDGKLQYTPHAWRENLMQKKLSKEAFINFRKLRDASETARYLSLTRISRIKREYKWIDKIASDYFALKDAKNLIKKDLIAFKAGINIL